MHQETYPPPVPSQLSPHVLFPRSDAPSCNSALWFTWALRGPRLTFWTLPPSRGLNARESRGLASRLLPPPTPLTFSSLRGASYPTSPFFSESPRSRRECWLLSPFFPLVFFRFTSTSCFFSCPRFSFQRLTSRRTRSPS